MSIEVKCPHCDASHHVNARLAGRSVRCPKCENLVSVPETASPADLEPDVVEVTEFDDLDASDQGMIEVVEVVGTEDSIEEVDSVGGVDPVQAVEQPVVAKTSPFQEGLVQVNPADVIAIDPADLAAAKGSIMLGDSGQSSQPSQQVDEEEDEDEKVLPRSERPEEEMDMTPMVDVTFLLLIFFMVTAAFSLQKSIEMPRQQTDAPSSATVEEEQDEKDMVEVQVDEFGSFLVMAPDWERETPGKQNLITTLREAMGGRSEGMRLVVKVHEMAKLRALVDAMDAGTIVGFEPLEVMQVEEFD